MPNSSATVADGGRHSEPEGVHPAPDVTQPNEAPDSAANRESVNRNVNGASTETPDTGHFDTLDELYPSGWALLLTPLCPRDCSGHGGEACASPGKRPLESRWNARAVGRLEGGEDRDAHLRAMTEHLDSGGNVGLVLPAGVVVLDVDDADSLKLAEGVDCLEAAPFQRSPKGGHFVVRVDDETASRWPQAVKLALANGMKVDLRLPGKGQIACEPSVHAATGAAYEWVRELPKSRGDIPELAADFVKMVDTAVTSEKSTSRAKPDGAGHVCEGGRNEYLTSEAGHLVNAGLMGETLRAALQGLNRTMCNPPLPDSELDAIVRSSASWEASEAEDEEKPKRTADRLLDLLVERAVLYPDANDVAFADVQVEGARHTYPVKSPRFKNWLKTAYKAESGTWVDSKNIEAAVDIAEAMAVNEGAVRAVHVRAAEGEDGCFYLDVADKEWRAIRITPGGWGVVESIDVPVRFRRPKQLHPLAMPERGGSVDELRPFINCESEDGFVLLVAFLLGALHPDLPYPVLGLRGEHGSAKSTTTKICHRVIDPSGLELQQPPRSPQEAAIIGSKTQLVSLDNLSTIQPWLSDVLCRRSTGGSSAYREHYENDELVTFDGRNPIILNGITSVVERPDLADRCLFVTLEPIADEKRVEEREILGRVDEMRGRVLGALLDAVAYGLKQLPDTKLDRLPRMADFARWVSACEGALPWEPGTFLAAYEANRATAVEDGVSEDPVAAAVRDFMQPRRDEWRGSCAELLSELNEFRGWGDGGTRPPPDWPKSTQKLTAAVDRASAPLRTLGIAVSRDRSHGRRVLVIQPPPRGSDNHGTHGTHGTSAMESEPCGVTSPSEGESHHGTTAPTSSRENAIEYGGLREGAEGAEGIGVFEDDF